MKRKIPLAILVAAMIALTVWFGWPRNQTPPTATAPSDETAQSEPTADPLPPPAAPPDEMPDVAATAVEPPPPPPPPRQYGNIRLRDLMLADNTYFDEEMGVLLTYPEGWSVRCASRWGENNRNTTVVMRPPDGSHARLGLYYQHYSAAHTGREDPEAYLRQLAATKETDRRVSGRIEYQNDPGSFVYRTFDGHPSLSYFATYIHEGEVHAEYFMRVLGPEGYVMFFMTGPAADVQAQIPAIYDMGTVITPP